ncbi:TonB-dependent receptor [Bacteroides xylanisolvens]|jgi:TonB-linked SusC/RagA family outer membrane protein|uniref:TonB-dependent receptor n=1 Tax=Bacteroides xylanisolvens TaxID=371601 RepID=UPI001CDC6330|nr:TonB-dependent receptor [Bacteroides xylanisolvens]MCA4456040.1 TonB-dependent receptor [Bacteroides xylanisolvens]MCA4460751.1 TonB-dependent receptor [Bacteroides xylanisolvens]MCA4474342.1 TonB-dependent receptor [Bacteroides xylanisolvens]MCA4483586.1 TonB-dependent receptor [Bacteroides xylanisolvens]
MLHSYTLKNDKKAKGIRFVLFLFMVVIQAAAFAQGGMKITIQKENITVIEALKEVEKQSKLSVGYNDSQLIDKPAINLNLKNIDLEKALSIILKGTGFTYGIKRNYINIIPQPKTGAVVIKQVTGRVVDEKNEPLIGVNIRVEGTDDGTVTDLEGKYVIKASIGSILSFTYIGYISSYVKIADKNVYNIQMSANVEALNEVVVTALGIKREQKALSYNVQQVKSDQLTNVKDANFINSLNGKVAGVNINSSSSGVGGASKVVMRGTKSIEQSSNALYVIDGIPMFNFGGGGSMENGSQGVTESIADINPDDIESISVLTGAAAAALYGSNAANGAIVINTKRGKVGKLQVSVSSNTEFAKPFVLPHFQNRYGTGSSGKAGNSTTLSWGTLLNDASRRNYEPRDFFDTGITYTNSITLSTGTDKNQTFFSAAAVNSEGIVPNNRYNRFNFTFRNATNFLNDRMKLDVGASYIIQNDRNMTNQGAYSNPIVPVYLFPRGDDFNLIKVFERWDPARKIKTMFWPQGEGDLRMQNPYWIAYRNLRTNDKKRYMLSASLSYDITDWLNISGRVRVDNSSTKYEQKLYASSNTTLTEGSAQGFYAISKPDETQVYADALANINKRLGDYSIVVNIGASIVDNKYDELSYRGPIRANGIPNVFNVFDLDNTQKKARQDEWEEQTQSIFASAEVGWKSMLYLTLTGRNDWASQLANSSSTCFFYPSIGLSAVVSEMVKLPSFVDYLKVRSSFSSVGMPYPRNLTSPTFEYDETTQTWKPKTHYPIGDLKPERTDSWEFGLDMRLFKDFNLSLSWYLANTFNQTFDPKISVSSGYTTIYLQTGYVRNQGVELSFGYGHTWKKDFRWQSNFTLSHNKNKIIELVKDYIHPETGEPINKDRLDVGGLGKARFILKTGGSLGDLYTQSDLKRDDNGMVEISPAGTLVTVNNRPDIKLGSVFPKCNLAWNNQFSWKGFNISALVTARIGGIVYSATAAAMDQYGVSESSAVARDNGGVLVNGRNRVDAQTWFTAIGSQSGLPQYYTYSATNIRLQEAAIGYTLPRKWLHDVCDIQLSVVGRNLCMIYNKAPFDPEAVATTGNYYQGIDFFMLPSTRNVGLNVKINF